MNFHQNSAFRFFFCGETDWSFRQIFRFEPSVGLLKQQKLILSRYYVGRSHAQRDVCLFEQHPACGQSWIGHVQPDELLKTCGRCESRCFFKHRLAGLAACWLCVASTVASRADARVRSRRARRPPIAAGMVLSAFANGRGILNGCCQSIFPELSHWSLENFQNAKHTIFAQYEIQILSPVASFLQTIHIHSMNITECQTY